MPYDAARLDDLARLFMRVALDDLLRKAAVADAALVFKSGQAQEPRPEAAPIAADAGASSRTK
jgi:hypothetical protein